MKITLKAARINAGLKQIDVANKLSVNITTISNWESGKTKPSIENFRKLCELYKWPENCIKF